MARAPLPTKLRAKPGGRQLILRWNAVDESRGYQVRVTEVGRVFRDWDWFPCSYGSDTSGVLNPYARVALTEGAD